MTPQERRTRIAQEFGESIRNAPHVPNERIERVLRENRTRNPMLALPTTREQANAIEAEERRYADERIARRAYKP